ncbi:malto-oligosyltrehalose trehalohydrolase [uncultured Gimesia sp.]|uniref:malto-oligosyltrehalose trehalohydrolase n=1 Tax=uncultured Gimesia sp. TaxID=1678688 RepID=UPI0030DB193E|tara:strand:- start:12315 stop:14972 length:2658 start_codon:yes stop_codon:yes gene_type:complete
MPTKKPNIPAVTSRGHVLATDLDGTFIPLEGNSQNRSALQTLTSQFAAHDISLIFVTGRHFESVIQAITEFQLPEPEWIICDVGTSIFKRQYSGTFTPVTAYQDYQNQIIAPMPIASLRERLQSTPGLRLQEEAKQGPFKLSFYADATQLDKLVDHIQADLDQTDAPYSIIHSIDPFNGDGLIDLLPATVSKAHALEWWIAAYTLNAEDIVFSGDSGNDLAALTAGYRTILVGNADRTLAQRVYQLHHESGWKNRLYLAHDSATSGVLEGCRWFGLAESSETTIERLGATSVTANETHFRVWAPQRKTVTVEIQDGDTTTEHNLNRDENGYFSGTARNARPGVYYQYRLDNSVSRPDPASHYQPQGVHGPSQILDHRDFAWTDQSWQGIPKRDLIIYELHLGTFTEDGTFRAAIERIPDLLDLGVTAVELMPVAQSPGHWNWGYDGVNLFAVRNTYGTVDDFKAFVDACHAAGLAVLLDVVYNHLGPEGNYLSEFGAYFSDNHHTPWGEAINYDGPDAAHVRQFITDNAIYWLEEFHLDGLRLDAVHCMYDDSPLTILDQIRQAVTKHDATTNWPLHLIAESNVYNHDMLTADQSRGAYDAIWCDCLMYSIYSHALPDVHLTHRKYEGIQDLADSLQHGYVYAGHESVRVTPQQRAAYQTEDQSNSHLASLVIALQTHDSVGNHPHGKRIHHLTSKEFQKAAAALVLLYPGIPLIFMGEECATDAPFPFFVDFEDHQLREAVDIGRKGNYPPHIWQDAYLPSNADAFYHAKWNNATHRDHDMHEWYRQLLQLRKQGLQTGWLSPANLKTDFSRDQNLFTLHYQHKTSTTTITARLTPPANTDANTDPKLIAVPLTGTLLLSSEPNPVIKANQLHLAPNHAIITQH